MAKIKIGPAFSDYVTPTRGRSRRNFSNFLPEEIIMLVPLILLCLAVGAIFFRLFYVQIVRGEYYTRLSDENRTRTELISAPRGIIYDRVGRPLVANSAVYIAEEDGKIKTIPQEEALKRIAKGKDIKAYVRRDYLYKEAFAHVLGYIGQVSEDEIILPQFADYGISDMVGKAGLEAQHESDLHGINGKRLFEVDAMGEKIRELGRQEPTIGKNIKTTLDVTIQQAVFHAFEGVNKGAAVVSDPRNGAILALFSSPTFDPNLFTSTEDYEPDGGYQNVDDVVLDNENQPLLNRAISGVYPPASTFKLVSGVAALEEGAIDGTTIIEDIGQIKIGDATFGNWFFIQYGRTDGPLDIVKAVSRSNDIFFYKAAGETGVTKISSWAHKFGLGEYTQIDLPGEVRGTVPLPDWKEEVIGEPWYLGDTYNYGIGQGYLLATPIQVNTFTNAFANHGTLFKPHLTPEGEKILKEDFLSRKNIDLIRRGMQDSCEPGGVAFPFFNFSAKNERLKIDGRNYTENASASAGMVRIHVGCKTGTAETGGDETKPHAWITVFAPFYDPEISVTVLVENSGEGSSVAGPIAAEILKDYFEKK